MAAVVCLLAGLACSTSGRRFDVDKVPQIEEGTTTASDVEAWFGPPVSIQRRPSGFAIYRYLHEEASVRDSGTFSRIAEYIGSFFGYRRARAPLNVRYENTVRHELVLLFDPEGVVTSYGYERSEEPSQSFY